ncbi:MAG: glycosyl hydrolase [Verrucomicrobia bacterium 12-59-8]|nr:MAG: glycosyl hydrolase [Verrucomicrobia bacterium 12-59-8]
MLLSLRPLSIAAVFSLGTLLNAADNPFIGRWALTIPGGGAGWLGVDEKDGALSSSVLWGGGSVVPTTSTKLDGDTLIVTREQKNKEGKLAAIETITAKTEGEVLKLTASKKNAAGKDMGQAQEFAGKRIADVPSAPDLSKVKFGDPIQLLNGKDLTGWRLLKEGVDNGWSVVDGVLENRVVKAKDKHFGNLRTDAEFEDFNLKAEVRTQEGSNSGIYLRGIYEVQVMESFGQPLDSHHMGALYSRITPSVAAEKPIGEWQTLDITLVDRHLTVILNGKTIIDNAPVLGCTGGAMSSDEFKPGPIYLQGDHTNVDYRNMVLTPVLK